MASLYWNYSTMNSGKSAHLLQVAHNYKERGMSTLLITAAVDDRTDVGVIYSRIGLKSPAMTFTHDTDIVELICGQFRVIPYDCILVDESQFLSAQQVYQLSTIVDKFNIPVMCYGLRTDFKGKLFDGSKALFELADKIQEHKTICHCGCKATMVLRLENGVPVTEGEQIQIGGNESYVSVCRKHYFEKKI